MADHASQDCESQPAQEEDDEMHDCIPQFGDEVLVTLRARALDGSVMDDRPPMEYQVGSGDLGPISSECEKLVLGMKVGDEANVNFGGPAHDGATLTLTLNKLYHTRDVSAAKDMTIVKKRLRAGRGCDTPMESAKVMLLVDAATNGFSPLAAFEKATLHFTLGNGEVCDVLELATKEMRKGERAMLKISSPALAVEPRLGLVDLCAERVVYYVELVDFENCSDPRSLALEELLAYALARKDIAAVLFKKGRLQLACQRYAHIVEVLSMLEDSDSKARELLNVCRLNKATCLVKLKGFARAKEACDLVLREEPENVNLVKAYYRRAQAAFGLESFADCIRDCKSAIGLDTSNTDARSLLKQAKESHQKSKGLFG